MPRMFEKDHSDKEERALLDRPAKNTLGRVELGRVDRDHRAGSTARTIVMAASTMTHAHATRRGAIRKTVPRAR